MRVRLMKGLLKGPWTLPEEMWRGLADGVAVRFLLLALVFGVSAVFWLLRLDLGSAFGALGFLCVAAFFWRLTIKEVMKDYEDDR